MEKQNKIFQTVKLAFCIQWKVLSKIKKKKVKCFKEKKKKKSVILLPACLHYNKC